MSIEQSSANDNTALQIELDCRYQNFQLTISQHWPSDKVIGLFGASGSGKSRLIRQILGLDQEYQRNCEISFAGKFWQSYKSDLYLATADRGIGYLPQSIDLFPHLNARENILFSQKQTAELSNEKQLLFDMAIEKLDLRDFLAQFPAQLSGGQKQRVGLARALIAARSCLLLDEALSAVGEKHQSQALQLIQWFNQRYAIPVIFASHSRVEHAFLTDYFVTLNQGKVQQSGLYDNIAIDINGEYAQMGDAINQIRAKTIAFDENNSVNQLATAEHTIWAGYEQVEAGSLVSLEVRAQDISLSLNDNEQSSILNCLQTTIEGFEEIARHQYLIKLSFEEQFLIAFITKKSFHALNLDKNKTVYARFKSVSVMPLLVTEHNKVVEDNRFAI